MAYQIFTDSGCDIDLEVLRQWGVRSSSLHFRFEGEDVEYKNEDMALDVFYDRVARGEVARTSAVNVETFREAFEEALKEGKDVLYIGFDSGISTTVNSGILAADELREDYPERTIIAIDTLQASIGQGIMVYMAVQKQKEGASIEEAADYVRSLIPHIATFFTVEDLIYLKRGGRISAASYFAASVLDIKPILHIDDEGHLISLEKVRGRRKSKAGLISAYEKLALDPGGLFMVGHSACEAEALEIKNEIEKRFGAKGMLSQVGTVIGSHTGPGVLVLSFPAKARK